EPDYTILIIVLSITIPAVVGSVIVLRQRKKAKIKKGKILEVQERVVEYFENVETLVEKMEFESAVLNLNECLAYVQKEGIKKYTPDIKANIKAVKTRNCRKD
ncbi:MAG: hypothetical protein ACTSPS_19985, partial [Promethearchaeota archaeon]